MKSWLVAGIFIVVTFSLLALDIHSSALLGRDKISELLLNTNAKINVQDKEGITLLMNAARACRVQTVKFLLKKGANSRLKNKAGKTAYKIALEDCPYKSSQAMKKAGL